MKTPPKDKGRTPAGCAPSKESNAGTNNTTSNPKTPTKRRRRKQAKSDEEIRQLVAKLEAARKALK